MSSINAETVTPEMLQPAQPAPQSGSEPEAVTPPPEQDDAAADESADQQQAESESSDDDQVEEEKPKRENGINKRIRELVEERNQERAERQKLTQQLADALKGKEPPPVQQPAAKVDEVPKVESFDKYEDYLGAMMEYKANQLFKAKQQEAWQAQQQAEQQRLVQEQHQRVIEQQSKLNALTQEGETKYPDFYEKVFPGQGKAVPISEIVGQALLESDKGVDLMYYLSTNRAEAERIAKLTPARQLVELGKLETSLPKIQQSKAPAPIKSVVGKRTTATDMPRDDDDMETWAKKEEARTKKSR